MGREKGNPKRVFAKRRTPTRNTGAPSDPAWVGGFAASTAVARQHGGADLTRHQLERMRTREDCMSGPWGPDTKYVVFRVGRFARRQHGIP